MRVVGVLGLALLLVGCASAERGELAIPDEPHLVVATCNVNRVSDVFPHIELREWQGAGGVALLSKHPLRDVRLIKPDRGWFPGLLARADTPLVVAGDFNEEEDGKAVTWLTDERGLTDALSEHDDDSPTWEWPVLSGAVTLRSRYDHILYSDQLRCVDARVTRIDASDHFPVTAVLVRR